MKKISILLAGVMALGLYSCQDEKTNAVPQSNPQLPVMSADALVLDAKLPATLDLSALAQAETPIVVGDVVSCANFPEGYELKLIGEVGRQAEFTNVGTIELKLTEDSLVYTSADDFEAAYVAAMGKSAKPKNVYFRILAYAVNATGTAQARLGGSDVYYADAQSTVTPYDLHIIIENGYGLLGTVNEWSVATAIKLNHSGLNVYDDPIFSHYFDITAGQAKTGWWWKVVPESTIAAGDWVDAANAQFGVAVNGDEALSGDLLPMRAEGDGFYQPNAGCVKAAGVYNFVADMENQTYEFVKALDILYLNGVYNAFDWDKAARLVSVDGNKYFGFAEISGEFKLYGQPDYAPVVYGKGVGPQGVKLDGGNINIKAAGFYMFNADLEAGQMPRAIITSLGLIGDHNNWGAQDNLTPSADYLTWTGTVTLGGEYKIRMNDSWDYNLGGSPDFLVAGGGNMVAEPGTYDVTLDLAHLPYTLTLVKK